MSGENPSAATSKRMFVLGATVAAVVALGFFIFTFLHKSSVMKKTSTTITARLSGQLTFPLTPENISTIPLYHVHSNLWGTLLSEHGSPGIAKLLVVADGGKLLQFQILPNMHFSNGRKISSKDIEFSFRRIMEKKPGAHFSARTAIKDFHILDEQSFAITLNEPTPSLLFLLSTPETAIVPPEACNEAGEIKDLSITSGAYTVEGTPTPDQLVLTKNPYFLTDNAQSPKRVVLKFRQASKSPEEDLKKEAFDFVEVCDNASMADMPNLEKMPEFQYKTTRPSVSWFLVQNPKKLSETQRLSISEITNSDFDEFYKSDSTLQKKSYEILPPATFGSLNLHAPFISGTGKRDLPKNIKLGVMDKTTPLSIAIQKTFEKNGITVEFTSIADDNADVSLWAQGMNYDFPEMEFYLNLVSSWSIISASASEKSLVMQALHAEDIKKRRELLRDIGRSLLSDGRVIPLFVRSYAHFYRSALINLDNVTDYDGDIPFWKMRVTPQ